MHVQVKVGLDEGETVAELGRKGQNKRLGIACGGEDEGEGCGVCVECLYCQHSRMSATP